MRKSSFSGFRLVSLLCMCLGLSGSLQAQSPASSSDTTSRTAHSPQSLIDVLVGLNHSRGVYFLFSQQSLAHVPVNPPILQPDLTVEKILTQVLKNTSLEFKKIDERTFVILNRNSTLRNNSYDAPGALTTAAPAMDSVLTAPGTVSGRVTTAGGKVLEGVSVTVKGTSKGISTDPEGNFDIRAGDGDLLVFSSVGYKTREASVTGAPHMDIRMEPLDQPLTEVLVTALGIQRQKRSIGYSTSDLDGSNFTQSRTINLGNALQGQVAGVSVMENATGPFGSSRVLIRGNASFSGNNQPLYVVDGIPYDNTNQGYPGQWGGTDLGDGLSNINPDDIESVLVLKGVAASALYGYRGGNGAILITTRSGARTHGIGVQVNNNLQFNTALDPRSYQYTYGQGVSGLKPVNAGMALSAPYYSWGARLDGSGAVNYLGNSYAYLPARDNFRHFFRTGMTDQTSISLTGANSRGHFDLGVSNLTLQAIVPNSSMKQQGVHFNSTSLLTNELQLTLTAGYVFEQVTNRASLSDNPGNVMAAPLYLANSFDIRWMKDHTMHPDGTEWLPGTTDLYFENPYYIAYDYSNSTTRNRLTGGLTLKYNLRPWLYLQGQVTRDGYTFDVTQIVPSGVEYTRSDGIHGGTLTQYSVNYHEVNGSFMAGVHKKLGTAFSFDADIGVNQQDNISNIYGIGAVPNSSNRPAGPFEVPGNYSPKNILIKPYSTYYQHYRVNSLFGTAQASYRNYLFLNLTARNDWFSTLNINTDHYLYPSASASMIFSEIWHMPSWISLGKLKASYAASSNGTEPYLNVLNYGVEGYTISGQTLGYISSNGLIPNGSLRPVEIAEQEAGLLMRFLHDRLGFDLTLYTKLTSNDIVKVTVSPTSGYSQDIENIGRIRNRGIELLLTGTPLKTRIFSWTSSFNYALNDNKVLYIGGLSGIVIDGAYPRWGSEVSISNVAGLPYGQIMGYAYKRNAAGRIIYSDGLTNTAPAGEPEQTGVAPLGSTVYRLTGGFTNEFRYKSFSLTVLIDYKFGAKLYSGTNLLLYYYGLQKATLQGREGGYIGKGVLENGHDNTIAVPAQQYFQDISAGGTDHIAEEFVYDASYIKLRSAILTYSFPPAFLVRKKIKGISISLTGRNLAILLKHTPNIDPESSLNNTNGQGLEQSGYPAARNWGMNVNLKF